MVYVIFVFAALSCVQKIPLLHQVCRETDAWQNLIKSLLFGSFSVANFFLCFQEVGKISKILHFLFLTRRAPSSSPICVIGKLSLHGSQFPKDEKRTN